MKSFDELMAGANKLLAGQTISTGPRVSNPRKVVGYLKPGDPALLAPKETMHYKFLPVEENVRQEVNVVLHLFPHDENPVPVEHAKAWKLVLELYTARLIVHTHDSRGPCFTADGCKEFE
jgi:hypothetical protein